MIGRKLTPLQIEELILQPGEDWVDAQGLWRLVRLQAGAAYWIGATLHLSLAVGDALVLGPEAQGTVRASQIGAVTLEAFSFSPDLLWGVFTVPERRFFESEAVGKQKADVKLLPGKELLPAQFANLVQCRAALSPLTQRLRTLELVAEVFSDQLSSQAVAPPKGGSSRQRFHRLIARLADNDLINLGPEELAHMCGCSSRHFNRMFRNEFGLSVRERQSDLRMIKAKALLVTSDEKIVDVAKSCGYRSLGHFNTVFKKSLNMTPSEWRKSAGSLRLKRD